MSNKNELTCPENCGHTEDEHQAFDRGVEDGEMGVEPVPPFDDPDLREAWHSGYSVGTINRVDQEK